jgi:hypothetical protein
VTTDIPLQCACGKLNGTALAVSPAAGTRVLCYCDDCQAFAHFLGRPDILEPGGGTDLFQTAPSRVRLANTDTLACVRLSDKGMHRWYCSECKTPVGNTMGPRVPFVGVIHRGIMLDRGGSGRDAVLGPPLAHVQTRYAVGGTPVRAGRLSTLRVVGRTVRLLATWWLTRAGSPSPFFDPATGAPRVAPRILTAEERLGLSPNATSSRARPHPGSPPAADH